MIMGKKYSSSLLKRPESPGTPDENKDIDTIEENQIEDTDIAIVGPCNPIKEKATPNKDSDEHQADIRESETPASALQLQHIGILSKEQSGSATGNSTSSIDKNVKIVVVKNVLGTGRTNVTNLHPKPVDNPKVESVSKANAICKHTHPHSSKGSTAKLLSEETYRLICDTMDICPVTESHTDEECTYRECVVCGKLFRFDSRLLIHLKQHLTQKGCECGFIHPCRDSVYRHQMNCLVNTRGRLVYEFDEEHFDYFKNSIVVPGNDVEDFPKGIIEATGVCKDLISSLKLDNPAMKKQKSISTCDAASAVRSIPEPSSVVAEPFIPQNSISSDIIYTSADKRKLPDLRSRLEVIEDRVSKLRKLADDLHSEAVDLKLKIADIELAND